MNLTEFDLDAPDSPKAERLRFRSESRGVTALFERFIGSLRVVRGWKVLVECVPSIENHGVTDLLGTLTVQVSADVPVVLALDVEEKQRAFLAALWTGVSQVVESEGWDMAKFLAAREQVQAAAFLNEWWWQKPKWNRSRKARGQLLCAHSFSGMSAWLVLTGKDGEELIRERVVKDCADEFEFVPLLGRAGWDDERTFSLRAEDGRLVGSVGL